MDTKEMCMNLENHVVMSNDLIKSKSNLSLNEIKLLRLTIMQVMIQDTDLQTYVVSITELGKALNISASNLYRDVYNMCRNLMQEIVFIGDGNPKHKWQMFQWCSSCRYNNGAITIKLHDDLKPYLIQLKKNYTQYMLEDVLLLKSIYAIRIYELIREGFKGQKVYADKVAYVSLNVETIRKATNTEDKYKQMGHLKSKVIDIALKEINEKLSYYVTCQNIKKSRKIVGFQFKIESKNNIFLGKIE